MNSKAQLDVQVIRVLVFIVVFTLIIFGIWAAATLGPLLIGVTKEIPTDLKAAVALTDNSSSPLGSATNTAADTATNILGTVEFMVYMVMLGLFIGYIVICYYVRTYKALAALWIMVILAMIAVSMVVSNAYITAANDPTLSTFYNTWGSNDFMMRNLPYIVGVVAMISGLLLFVIMQREPEEEDTAL